MKRLSFLWWGVLLVLCLGVTGVLAQMGPGMMGMHGKQVAIPEKLPTPKNAEWINKLRQIFALEKLSQAQYEADREKYQVNRPYMMVIPQEENHVEWIGRLFSAYGLPADGRVPPVEQSQSLEQAYKIALKLEEDLIPQYQWLIANAEDQTSGQVLGTILHQTQMHYRMFSHALGMGGGMGHRMGGRGMRHGGPGMGGQ
jgi:rubrerythrin